MPEPQDALVARSTQSGSSIPDRLQDLVMGTRRPFELRIDGQGIEVTGAAGLSAAWADIADVYVLTMGRSRYLVYQLTPEVAAAHGHSNAALLGRWHDPKLLYAPQPGVNMAVLDRDEHEVLSAVEHISGGRFPTPERVWNGPSGKDILRRDLHNLRPRRGRGGRAGEIDDR